MSGLDCGNPAIGMRWGFEKFINFAIVMKTISHWLSGIFSPLLVPTYAISLILWVSTLSVLGLGVKLRLILITFFITAVVPCGAIMVLYRAGMVSDAALNNRTQRTIPYLVTMLSYLGAACFFWRASAPGWLTMFLTAGAGACVLNLIVNRWWKISAHAAAMGGLIGLGFKLVWLHQAVVNMNVWLTVIVVATGMVMSARVYLGRHTLGQVMAGCANGLVWVWLLA